MKITFKVQRQQGNGDRHWQNYALEVDTQATVLDCLNQIKWQQDGSLAFRKNCRNAICGSCALRVNDRPVLACKESIKNLEQWLTDSNQENTGIFTISPLGNLPVIKDLVVDMNKFFAGLDAVYPYLMNKRQRENGSEFLQSPAQRAALNDVSNCVLCGVCYSDCDAKKKNDNFVGPHALAKAHRLILDNRDMASKARLEALGKDKQGVWGCNNCRMCSDSCPTGVAPLSQIEALKIRLFDLMDPL
ncbi:succinate dehydrogenase iron-sulfur subunit [Synechocystis sp. FACHB-383]|uniref:succinate dehydrogenase iron-sulfur subunit n=1 Tax=Synechocystis sp. FACHB-383 TaxID=2692864 RepID=UPI001689F5D5|nr:succinate dehydrogenase iron-sulfur subunit [Synechocystis sp. FACHB-383]MBD2653327.1 succinate dehydrogenase iron-sulfur subunit [Synechocystis sp. FACHB-383]